MLMSLIERLKKLTNEKEVFDPSVFQDSIADNTNWAPNKRGGANFCTHRLVKVSPLVVEFKATVIVKVFYGIFVLVGLGAFTFIYQRLMSGNPKLDIETVFLGLFAAVFLIVGIVMFHYGSKSIVFDRRKGCFWKGKKEPNIYRTSQKKELATYLTDIHALQLVSEYCRSDKSSYYSYELNLVLKDASRINVIDHGSIGKLREDAEEFAQFLDIPVWDAVRNR